MVLNVSLYINYNYHIVIGGLFINGGYHRGQARAIRVGSYILRYVFGLYELTFGLKVCQVFVFFGGFGHYGTYACHCQVSQGYTYLVGEAREDGALRGLFSASMGHGQRSTTSGFSRNYGIKFCSMGLLDATR